jgi:hypothetical protein
MWHALWEEIYMQDFGGEARRKNPLGNYRRRCKDIIKITLKTWSG